MRPPFVCVRGDYRGGPPRLTRGSRTRGKKNGPRTAYTQSVAHSSFPSRAGLLGLLALFVAALGALLDLHQPVVGIVLLRDDDVAQAVLLEHAIEHLLDRLVLARVRDGLVARDADGVEDFQPLE